MVIYACSSNPGKLKEFALAARQFAGSDIVIEPLPGLQQISAPPENGTSFEENAAVKAIYYSRFTRELVFADDSGLEIDALHGEPGVHSAYYAGPRATDEQNNLLVLERMREVVNRRARFVCVIAIARQGELLGSVRGAAEGEILQAPRGSNGFGYDPLFFFPPLARSFAELTPEEKFEVSHRGQAVRAMIQWLRDNPSGSHSSPVPIR